MKLNDVPGIELNGNFIFVAPEKMEVEVEVYYDPDDPREAILQPGTQKGWGPIISGLFFALLSASFLGAVDLSHEH